MKPRSPDRFADSGLVTDADAVFERFMAGLVLHIDIDYTGDHGEFEFVYPSETIAYGEVDRKNIWRLLKSFKLKTILQRHRECGPGIYIAPNDYDESKYSISEKELRLTTKEELEGLVLNNAYLMSFGFANVLPSWLTKEYVKALPEQ